MVSHAIVADSFLLWLSVLYDISAVSSYMTEMRLSSKAAKIV